MITVQARRVPSLFITSIMICIVGLFLFIALLNGQRDLIILSLLVFIMAGGLKLWARSSSSSIECSLAISRNRVFAGERLSVTVSAENGKPLPVFLEVSVPVGGLSPNTFSEEVPLKGEGNLLWYQMMRFQQELTAEARGVYEIGPLKVTSGDLFGFFVKETVIEKRLQVIVYPKLVLLGQFSLPKRDFFGVPGSESPVNDPVYILGTTDYHHGSPARYIHWKASARHNRLQEKVFEPTQQEKVLIVVDVDRFAHDHAEEAFEHTLEVAGSMAVRLDRQGCAVGFLTNGITKEASSAVSITRSSRQTASILEVLARLEMVPKEAFIDTLRHTPGIPWGTSCVYFILKEDGTTRVIKEHFRRSRIPVLFFAFDAVSALRKNVPVKFGTAAGPESVREEENIFIRDTRIS